jgi:hypothetical protein
MKWIKEEDGVLKKYYPYFRWKKLLKLLPNRTKAAIQKRTHSLGIKRIFTEYSWSPKENKLLKKIYLNHSMFDTMKKIPGRTQSAVQERIKKLRLKHSKFYNELPNSSGDLRLLLQETNRAYYWIGFLSADGHFDGNCIHLLVAKKDKQHIYKYVKFIGSPIRKTIKPDKRMYYYTSCDHKINTNKIEKKFGFTSRKTYNPPNSKISKKNRLFMSYMIGYIDGDGYVLYREKNGDGGSRYIISVGCYKTWKHWLIKTFQRMAKILKVNMHLCVSKKHNGSGIEVIIASKIFMKKLRQYADKLKIPYLKRKIGKIKF